MPTSDDGLDLKTKDQSQLDYSRAFLRPNIKIEPLIDRWPAWPHLLAPAQQAMNLAFRHLPALRSFLAAPAVHQAANDDPEMFGGPFVALPGSASALVAQYLDEIVDRRAAAIRFANDFRDFDLRLQASANGYSLSNSWAELPESLKGRVELVYDLNHHPKIRLLDEMFIDDDLGLADSQGILLHDLPDWDRPFFLSTPRLRPSDGLFIKAKFASAGVKRLCEARHKPVDLTALSGELAIPAKTLAKYFTNEQPATPNMRYRGPGLRLRYFGHASVLVENSDAAILIDPSFALDHVSGQEHLLLGDLPERLDFVILSHGHQDHLSVEYLMSIRDRVGTVVVPSCNRGELCDPSMAMMLHAIGFDSVREVDPLGEIEFPGGKLTSLPFSGEHCDLDVRGKHCFMLESRGNRVGVFVDSDAIDIDVYRRLADRIREPDVMLVGMECNGAPLSWLYGPLLSSPLTKRIDNSRRLSGANCDQAWALVREIQPRRAFVYAMGQEAWMRPLMGLNYVPDSIQLLESSSFVDKCRSIGIESERLLYNKEIILEDKACHG